MSCSSYGFQSALRSSVKCQAEDPVRGRQGVSSLMTTAPPGAPCCSVAEAGTDQPFWGCSSVPDTQHSWPWWLLLHFRLVRSVLLHWELTILPDVTSSAFKREATLRILGDSSLRPPESSLLQTFVHFSKVDKATEIYYTSGNFFPKSTKPFRCALRRARFSGTSAFWSPIQGDLTNTPKTPLAFLQAKWANEIIH